MGQLVGVRDVYQIGLGAAPIRTGGNRFVFRDPMTGKTASGLMSVLEWNVAADKWVQVAPPQGDRPGSEFSAGVNRQLEVVWSQPIGRLRPPPRPSEAELTSGTSVLPYKPPGSTIPTAPTPAAAPAPTPAMATALTPATALLPVPSIDVAAPVPIVAPVRAPAVTAEPAAFPPSTLIVNGVTPTAPSAEGTIVDGVSALSEIPVWVWVVGGIGAIWIFTRK